MPPRILVTGATGHVGGAVLDAALGRGLPVVAAMRDATVPAPHGVRTVALDFRDRSTWPRALEGCTRLFLMRPPAISDIAATLAPFIDEAQRRGVGHVVFLSVAGAERNRLLPHRKVEDHLARSSIDWTVLRPGFFAQNLEDAYREDILRDDRLYVPAGHAPVNWIDVRDIGEAAAGILADPGVHRAKAYTLAGPGPLAWDTVAAMLTASTGRPIRYRPASVPGYVAHLRRRGLPWPMIGVQTLLHVLLRFGQGAGTDPTLEALLGHRPRTLAAYIHDRAEMWRR